MEVARGQQKLETVSQTTWS